MDDFVRAHEQDVIGVLHGFDRRVLRGTLRRLALVGGMASYRHAVGVLLKDFDTFADQQTKRLREASMAAARGLERPIVYLSRPRISKEETARAIAEQDRISEDLVRILKAVESCQSFGIYRNRETGKLGLQARRRQGLALYRYWIDPTFGFMNARIQTWFPFSIQGNSVKAYDTAGRVLRIETTINNAPGFKLYRPREGDTEGQLDWRPMRNVFADLHRRTPVSQAANERYAGALATVEIKRCLGEAAARICAPVAWKGARVRGLRPFSAGDHALFAAVACGAFAVDGLRNRDLLAKLLPGQHAPDQRRRLSSRMTRKLRLLRAHGIIRKVPRSHRYTITPKGREILSAFLHAHQASVNDLVKMAA
jgi:hypothetical protein